MSPNPRSFCLGGLPVVVDKLMPPGRATLFGGRIVCNSIADAERLVHRMNHQQGQRGMEAVFLKDIIAHPADDTPRLVFADWLDDNGREERAEFIRAQCAGGDLSYRLQYRIDKHGWRSFAIIPALEDMVLKFHKAGGSYPGYSWGSCGSPTGPGLYKCGAAEVYIEYKDLFRLIFRRGFVAEVRISMLDWCGYVCERCHGVGKANRESGFAPVVFDRCGDCAGEGVVIDYGPDIVMTAPIEVVRFSDREPQETYRPSAHGTGITSWWWNWVDEEALDGRRHFLPKRLFRLLIGGEFCYSQEPIPSRRYSSKEEAEDDLSQAALALARNSLAKRERCGQ